MHDGIFTFFILSLGNTLGAHLEILERQKKRLKLRQVHSVDECNVVLAFVPQASRVGTDVINALETIPTNHPVVLIVIYNTFDPDKVVPDSKDYVKHLNNVLMVDFLYFEDTGLLQCQKNDISAKMITDHLKSLGASTQDMQSADAFMRGWIHVNRKTILLSGLALCFLFVFIWFLYFVIVWCLH